MTAGETIDDEINDIYERIDLIMGYLKLEFKENGFGGVVGVTKRQDKPGKEEDE